LVKALGDSLRHLAYDALSAAIKMPTSAADAVYVGNMLSGEVSGQAHLGALVADFAGLRGVEAVKVEAACASAAAAFRQAYIGVASGLQDIVIAVGVEKMTDDIGSKITAGLRRGGRRLAVIRGQFWPERAHYAALYVRIHLIGRRLPVSPSTHITAYVTQCDVSQPHQPGRFSAPDMIADPVGLLDASGMATARRQLSFAHRAGPRIYQQCHPYQGQRRRHR
jgi:acetyl-CoA C-acetyltransferase